MCFLDEQLAEFFNQHPKVGKLLTEIIRADTICECAGAVFDYGPEDFSPRTLLEVIEFEAHVEMPEGHKRFITPEMYQEVKRHLSEATDENYDDIEQRQVWRNNNLGSGEEQRMWYVIEYQTEDERAVFLFSEVPEEEVRTHLVAGTHPEKISPPHFYPHKCGSRSSYVQHVQDYASGRIATARYCDDSIGSMVFFSKTFEEAFVALAQKHPTSAIVLLKAILQPIDSGQDSYDQEHVYDFLTWIEQAKEEGIVQTLEEE